MDTLRRDDFAPASDTAHFDALDTASQIVLRRAASRGAANCTPEMFECVGRDWLMVPSKLGPRQVVVTESRAFRL